MLRVLAPGTDGPVSDLSVSPDGKTLAAVFYHIEGTITLWNLASGIEQTGLWMQPGWGSEEIAFSPDGLRLLACSTAYNYRDSRIWLWSIQASAAADHPAR
jgi:WD40 repeat protein